MGYLNNRRVIAVIFIILFITNCPAVCQRLELFTSESHTVYRNDIPEKVPYKKVVSFFDYIRSEQIADTVIDGKNYNSIYFELLNKPEEIGIRVISPVPEYVYAGPGDEVTEVYPANAHNKEWFDPELILEWLKRDTSTLNGKTVEVLTWKILGKNDNSAETIPLPSGEKNNSVFRIKSELLNTGLYRILITSANKLKQSGTYMVSVGIVPPVKQLKLKRKIADLSIESE
jgi:hypothetical protein